MGQTPETKDAVKDGPGVASDRDTAENYTHGTRLVALTTSLMLGMFLVALDNVRGY
jgi:hypothetical protein